MSTRSRGTFLLAAVLFFLSGALGLGYELVWIHKASLVVGASQLALATVLTSLFLGLALGSLVVGRYLRSRRWSPLFVYGLFEAAIGVFALLFPLLFGGLEATYGALYPFFDASGAGLFFLRFSLLFALFLVPTFFMGGTLPLLLDGLVARDRSIGALTSFLYGLNILGAVMGVLATSYFAIPNLGLSATSQAAGLCNLAIGAVALVSFRGLKPLHVPAGAASIPPLPVFFGAVSFVSGLAAIGYQVVWARYFTLLGRNDVHAAAVLLAVYLSALAIGSMVLAPVLRSRIHPLRVLVFLQPLVPILAFLCLEAWPLVVYRFKVLDNYEAVPRWYFWSENVDTVFVAPLLVVASVILLPVTLLGTGLPAIIAAAAHRAGALRSTAGSLVFWNTLGASAGGVAAGYALIPVLGLTGAFAALAVLSVGLSLAAEWRLSRDSNSLVRRLLRPGYVPAAIGLLFILVWVQDDITRRTLLRFSGSSLFEENSLIAIREGPVTTAYVFDGSQSRSLGAGSVRMARAPRYELSPQELQGYLPALFFPKEGWPESVLGIAVGSGQTFGALLRGPVKRMDVVDISAEIVELATEYFATFNNGLGEDERVHFHFDDGRHFVARAPPASYDVVSLEPPPPTNDGVYRLYSLEFYQSVHRALREHGVLAQWLPPYLITPNDLRGMVKTQAEVFPHTFIIQIGPKDFVMLSVKGESVPPLRTAWIEERTRLLGAGPGMKPMRWAGEWGRNAVSLKQVLLLLVTGPEDIARMEAPYLHREDDQRLSYSSGDRQLQYRYIGRGLDELSFGAVPVTPFANLQRYFADPIPTVELEAMRAAALSRYGVVSPPSLALAEDDFSRETDPKARSQRALAIAELYSRRHGIREALDWLQKAVAADPTDSRPESIESARQFAVSRSILYGREIREWLAKLPESHRASPLVKVIAEELRASEQREAERRSRYLWR
ncbi:MAG: spermine/spermidine synthase domain-containing protein [Planctomycetota bacterium]|jgi:predicted membrane-bound spermidine synthase